MQDGPDTSETLYLIDGHAQIFRAYFAIRGGLNSPVTGEPTQAVYGMTGMFLKLLTTFKPQYVVMAIDTPGKTFRDEMFNDYKANRAPTPPDLEAQIPRILEITRLFGIPVIGQTGAEADDIIATITRRLLNDPKCKHLNIRIVSKDKDLQQLLNDRVQMFDIHTDTTIDAAWLKENKGIAPQQVIDLLALTGDTVDNVPGVPGVGAKTAAKLIQDYGSIEGIYANLDKLKGKLRENLEASRQTLEVSRTLVTLKSDLELDFTLEKARAGLIEMAGLRRVFEELGFRKHITDLEALVNRGSDSTAKTAGDAASGKSKQAPARKDDADFSPSLFEAVAPAVTSDGQAEPSNHIRTPGLTTADDFAYRAIVTTGELDELVHSLRTAPIISVDTETIGLGGAMAMCGMSFSWQAGTGVYIPLRSPDPSQHLDQRAVLEKLRPILEDPTRPKCGHNLKYDALVFRHAGVRLRGIVFDSMIASHLAGSPTHGLDSLALSCLKHEMIPITRLIGLAETRKKGAGQRTMDQVPLELIVPYASEDADIALRLHEHFMPRLRLMGMERLAAEIEMPLVEVLSEMEFHGIKVDPAVLIQQQQVLNTRIVQLRRDILDKAQFDFNPDSPKQLAEVLFTHLGLPVQKKTKTGPSTDIEVLETLAELDGIDPAKQAVPRLIVEYRQLTKLVGTYLENLRESIRASTGRVHAQFHQAATATGRLSSNGPNLQNIPIRTEVGRQIRKAFIAEPGNVLISADYSQIELRVLAHLSQDPRLTEAFAKDLDVHTDVAAQVFGVPFDQVTREQRNQAKIINFGIVYGVSAYGLVRRIEGLDLESAKKLIADYRTRFKGIDTFLQACVQEAMDKGYVETMGGRRRMIPELRSENGAQRSLGQRLAINSVVQGSAAELIKRAMVNLQRRIDADGLTMMMLLQIHDELVFESPADDAEKNAAIIKAEMESAMTLRIPLKVEVGVGKDWLETK